MESSEKIKLVHITDMHLSKSKEALYKELNPFDSYIEVLSNIKQSNWKPDALIVTGDISNDGSIESYKNAFNEFISLKIPILCIPGNHDCKKNLITCLSQNTTCTLQIISNWVFIGLDTSLKTNPSGFLNSNELSKLKTRIQEHYKKNIIICLHHQPVLLNSKWIDEIGLKNKKEFFEVIKKYKNIKGIFFGHIHQEFNSNLNNIGIYGTPSTCRQFKPGKKKFELDVLPPAYRRIELSRNGTIKSNVVWIDH
jgi:Icc protein